ncbi:ABC-2 type transporter superfamily [Verrucomicrobiia bacterium DG1235]|nr:ABC-2 type transporter superfamily [Verrucomicrobiae bacterium DG1235]
MSLNEQPKVRIYEPGSDLRHPGQFFRLLSEDLSTCWELSWQLFVRDLKAQYRQSFLGYFWAFAPPLLNAGVFIFLQSSGAVQIEDTGVPYPLFVMIGTLMWQSVVEALMNPGLGMSKAKGILSKINFPRESILLASIWLLLFNVMIRMLILASLLIFYKVELQLAALWFPVAFTSLLTLSLSIGILLSIVGSLYTDIVRGLPIITQFLMFLSPIIYPPRDSGIIGFLSSWNPISPLLTSARHGLLGQQQTQLFEISIFIPISFALFLFSWLAFKLVLPRLIERMPS